MTNEPQSSMAEALNKAADKIESSQIGGPEQAQGQQQEGQDLVGQNADDSNQIPDPGEWTTAGDEMTEPQRQYLAALANRAGETLDVSNMSKAEASQHIDRLRQQTGVGQTNQAGGQQ